ncbi:alpha/beta fold hydrolase [Bacillus sp. CGMCC 1.16607]|uniref:alpha/beta fold hydrolase n=1 Tax=Bacillus sp. CGMCC 1.16607 TaxID=3351842 RepID=UPI0036274715
MKRFSKSVGKIVLASSIGLSGAAASFTLPVQAADVTQKVEFDKLGDQFITYTKENKWDQVYGMLSANLQPSFTKEALPLIWASITTPYGKISDIKQSNVSFNGVHTKVSYLFTTEKGPFELVVLFNHLGQIDDLNVKQVYPPNFFLNPSYNHPEKYTEKQVVVGEGAFALSGVLTVPKGEGPFPVVVLVHGSGPNDMDQTAYSFKSFRDLAVGLANQGVAVLRYDKRTNVHPLKVSTTPKFSIQEETVIDANLAVKALKSIPEVDSKNIFVVGHSQGAFALPLIVEGDKNHDIKGAIGIAGNASKFHELYLWQMEQILARMQAANAPAEHLKVQEASVQVLREQVALINNPSYSKDNPPANFQLGNPYWWYDLRDYQPAELAKKQDLPLLLLQAGKDVQVPVSEFQLWKDTLKDRKNVDYKLYPNMFHVLVDYAGQPDGQTEYMTPGNVSEELIADISTWVKTGKLASKVDLTIFKDYKAGQDWSDAFAWALEKGIIQGFATEKLLKPEEAMSESQFLKVFFRYSLGAELKDESTKAIYQLAKEQGLPVTGKANASISRGDAALLLANSFLKSKKSMTKEEAVQWLYESGVTNGYADQDGNFPKTFKSFKPEAAISRGEFVTLLKGLDDK